MYINSTLKGIRKQTLLLAVTAGTLFLADSGYAQNCNTDFTNGIQANNITASSENPPNEDRTKAFDNVVTTKWLAVANTGSLTVNLVTPKLVKYYSITSANDVPARDPKSWVIEGSNDGSIFTSLDTRTGISFSSRYLTQNFNFSNTTAYQYYRIRITANNGAASLQLAEVQFLPSSTCEETTIPCATHELMADTRFLFPQASGSNVAIDGLSSNGWTGSGNGVATISSNYTYLYENSYTQTFTHAFTGVNSVGAGAVVTISAGIRNGIEGIPTIVDWGKASVLTIKYGGLAFATVTTDSTTKSDGHIGTVNYLNGATGSLPDDYTFDYGSSPQGWGIMDLTAWQIFLPASISNNGDLVVEFNPGGSSSGVAADDFNIGAISLKACQISVSGNILNDIDALTDNAVDNNGGAQPASTLPAGLTANLFNATTGLFIATANVNNGIYTFENVASNTNYRVIISNVTATTSKTVTTFPSLLPSGWANTGDVNPTDPIPTALSPGISSIVEVSTSSIDNVNFGIRNLAEITPVPITLESFKGIITACNAATFSWKITEAVNFSHFELEKSLNGIDFSIAGSVNFNKANTAYTFNEQNLENGSWQYRLKMVDGDGQYKYSPVVFITFDCRQQRLIQIYPNPAKDKVTIKGLNSGEEIVIYNTSGQVAQNKKVTVNQLYIDMTAMTSGVYYIIVKNNNGIKVSESKIIKIH